jgi:hypothetical protein
MATEQGHQAPTICTSLFADDATIFVTPSENGINSLAYILANLLMSPTL